MAYTAVTWSQIRQDIKDDLEHKAFWDDADLLRAFNETLYLWNLLTGRWRTSITFPTVAGQYLYSLSSSLLYRTRLSIAGRPLISSSRQELNWSRRSWRSETTTSGGDVPSRVTLFAPVSLRSVYLWPADAAGGLTVTVEGVAATPVLVEDADFLDLGGEDLHTLLHCTLHVLSFRKGGQAFAATQDLFKGFLAAAADRNDLIRTTTAYRQIMGLDRRDLKPLRSPAEAQV